MDFQIRKFFYLRKIIDFSSQIKKKSIWQKDIIELKK